MQLPSVLNDIKKNIHHLSDNLTNAPPPTPPPSHPLPPVPISLSNNSKCGASSRATFAKAWTQSQRLKEKNVQNQQLVETLESILNENEINLNLAKQELAIIQSQKMDLIRQVKSLKSQLDEAKDEIESTKYSVKSEKQVMEKVLEKSERARVALENQMEKLMAKRNKFMCF
ncbi:24420_t:CDS:2 [Dentiscutata erythropus]|uniref:24420_t:CDS:1 n=1 Tax=Dentiscutata erythropus TaxID=1348616 RepID=A0A9N8VAA5_9GLOM|nr:24420_t:CDS:2 [Dentiscutata erythropus]